MHSCRLRKRHEHKHEIKLYADQNNRGAFPKLTNFGLYVNKACRLAQS